MESNIKDQLKKFSKDEKSFEALKELFTKMLEKYEQEHEHLQLLESAIRNDYDSILITELNLEEPGPRIVYVNDGFCKMTGWTKEEVIGKTPRILQGPKTDRAVLDKLKKKLEEGQSFFGKAVNYRKDGSEFVNQWDIHPLTDAEGDITHWVSYQHDITERKRAENVLVDAQEEFDKLREDSKRTVLDVDAQGNIVMANKAFRELIGYAKDELKQIKAWELFPKKYRDSLKSRFDDGLSEKNFDDQQFKGIIKHRSGVPIQIEGKTRIMELKEYTLIRAEVKNITLQKRIMEALRRRNSDYSRIFEKASEFTYRVKLKDGKLHFEYISEEFPELTGISPAKLLDEGEIEGFVHADDLEELRKHVKEVMGGKSCTCEYRIRNVKGDYVRIVDYGKPEWDSNEEKVVCAKGAVSIKESAKRS